MLMRGNVRLAIKPSFPTSIFVLCTGRCGSVTFSKAAAHITNFTSGHETRCHLTGADRFKYPHRHIEADNRLSWLLGRLDREYGDEPLYIHLTRDADAVANSYLRRADRGIILAYRTEILMRAQRLNSDNPLLDFCRDYVDTVNENIKHFLRNKPRKLDFKLELAKEDFKIFWNAIAAEGDFSSALSEWDVCYNRSPSENASVVDPAASRTDLK